jgi:hypothetical protein
MAEAPSAPPQEKTKSDTQPGGTANLARTLVNRATALGFVSYGTTRTVQEIAQRSADHPATGTVNSQHELNSPYGPEIQLEPRPGSTYIGSDGTNTYWLAPGDSDETKLIIKLTPSGEQVTLKEVDSSTQKVFISTEGKPYVATYQTKPNPQWEVTDLTDTLLARFTPPEGHSYDFNVKNDVFIATYWNRTEAGQLEHNHQTFTHPNTPEEYKLTIPEERSPSYPVVRFDHSNKKFAVFRVVNKQNQETIFVGDTSSDNHALDELTDIGPHLDLKLADRQLDAFWLNETQLLVLVNPSPYSQSNSSPGGELLVFDTTTHSVIARRDISDGYAAVSVIQHPRTHHTLIEIKDLAPS